MNNRQLLGIAFTAVIGTVGGSFLGYRKGRKKADKMIAHSVDVMLLAADYLQEIEKGVHNNVDDYAAWEETCQNKAEFFMIALHAMD